jgi:hypothetical protein
MNNHHAKSSTVLPIPANHRNSPGSLVWLCKRGLMFPSDLAHDYETIREPQGQYSVSIPEDRIDGR